MNKLTTLSFVLLLSLTGSRCSSPTSSNNQTPTTDFTATAEPIATPISEAHQPVETQTVTGVLPFGNTSEPPTANPLGPDEVSVDAGITYQTIDGFGATHNSLIYDGPGDVLSPTLRSNAIEAVYHQVGLNLGNLEGALLESPGSYDQRSNDNDDPNEFNWAGFQTFGADAAQSELLALAEPYGFNGYYINQRVNIRWASPWLDEIRSADYRRYLEEAAEQIAAGNIYWRDKYGITPRYIMIFNEPLSGNGEVLSSDGNPQQVVNLVNAAGARLEKEGFSEVKFVIPNEETVAQSLETASAILSDPDARKYVGVIGYHAYPYGSTYADVNNILKTSGSGAPDPEALAVRAQLRQLSQQYGVPVWMTEVSHGYVDPRSYDDFRGRAIHIHDEFVYANASAYFGMGNMWDTNSHEMHFGNRSIFDPGNEGNIVLIDSDQQQVNITGMGYAIGQYARWIKPGAKRVDAATGDPRLQISAFLSPDLSQLILVLINNNTASKKIQVDVRSADLVGSISGEQSSSGQYWKAIPEFDTSSPTSFTATLPAESVTTYALSLDHN